MQDKTKQIATMSRWFRMEILGLTLSDICEGTGVKIGTLSNFEQGRSTNLTHIYHYLEKSNNQQKTTFTNELNLILKGAEL